jgi:hypothetical protein
MPCAVYVDTRLIQQFVFLSNELKDIIGASYLVEHLFDKLIMLEECRLRGYEGGGNILLVFDSKASALDTVTKLSISAIGDCPGLLFSAVVMDDFDENNFEQSMQTLRSMLAKEKDNRIAITDLPSYGITASCANTGLSAEFIDNGKPISEVIQAKRNVTQPKIMQDDLHYFSTKPAYCFAEKFEEMGQDKGNDSHIAIVHIDGNGIGNLIRCQKSLRDIQNVSVSIKQAVQFASKQMVNNLINMIPHCNHLSITTKGGKVILPLRPIICGGDDITFVCEGRLALDLSIDFINAFEEFVNCNEFLSNYGITCCAGIAIIKTKFPFYLAYTLAEDLCSNAKTVRNHRGIVNSMIDYHLLSGSQIGEIEVIRKKGNVNKDRNSTTAKPYSVSELSLLMQNADQLKKEWPTTRIMELREVLHQSQAEQNEFLVHMHSRNETLPCIGFDEFQRELFVDQKTIYADMVEIIDLITYPQRKESK